MTLTLSPKLREDAVDVIKTFIAATVSDARATGVVVGLSGGLDSAVVAKLCTDALGSAKVFALILPERELHGFYKDAADAKAFSKTLGIDYKIIDISPIIKTIQNACTPPGAYEPDRITIGNVKARARMVVLYYYANLMNRLVAGTGNKSELLTGYFTKYGDGGSDILPIGDLYKTQVKVLAERIGIPQEIIAKTPSAGLWVGQSDEAELGISYELLDKILHGLELSIAPEDISAKLNIDVSEVIRVRNMVTRGVHKRKFSRIPKLGIKTVGLDLREDHHKSL